MHLAQTVVDEHAGIVAVSSKAIVSCDVCGWESKPTTPALAEAAYVLHPCSQPRPEPFAGEPVPGSGLVVVQAPEVVRRFTPDGGGGVEVVVSSPMVPSTAEEAARAFLAGYLQSPNTFRSYERTLQEWFGFCRSARVDPLAATRPFVEAYKTWLYDCGRRPTTVTQRLVAVSSFYNYCCDELVLPRNPVKGVRRPKITSEPKSTGLDRDELRTFLDAAKRDHPMTYALMCLLAFNGLRASEPGTIDIGDLTTVRGHHTAMVGRKGRSEKVRIPLAPVTWQALDSWLGPRADALGQIGKGTGWLFLTFTRGGHELQGKPPERRDVHRWVARIGKLAGLTDKPNLHPHDLRHAFITLALDAGVPLQEVQDSAGHASPLTTQRYNRHRHLMDRHATYTLAAYLGHGDATPDPGRDHR